MHDDKWVREIEQSLTRQWTIIENRERDLIRTQVVLDEAQQSGCDQTIQRAVLAHRSAGVDVSVARAGLETLLC